MSQLLQNHIRPIDPRRWRRLKPEALTPRNFSARSGRRPEAASRRFAVPYREQGQVVAIRTGRLRVGFTGLQGAEWLGMSEPPLYNVDCLRDASLADEPLLVVESEMACWAALASGFRRVVGVPTSIVDRQGRAATPARPRPRICCAMCREVVICHLRRRERARAAGEHRRDDRRRPLQVGELPQGLLGPAGHLPHLRGERRAGDDRAAQWFAMPGFYS